MVDEARRILSVVALCMACAPAPSVPVEAGESSGRPGGGGAASGGTLGGSSGPEALPDEPTGGASGTDTSVWDPHPPGYCFWQPEWGAESLQRPDARVLDSVERLATYGLIPFAEGAVAWWGADEVAVIVVDDQGATTNAFTLPSLRSRLVACEGQIAFVDAEGRVRRVGPDGRPTADDLEIGEGAWFEVACAPGSLAVVREDENGVGWFQAFDADGVAVVTPASVGPWTASTHRLLWDGAEYVGVGVIVHRVDSPDRGWTYTTTVKLAHIDEAGAVRWNLVETETSPRTGTFGVAAAEGVLVLGWSRLNALQLIRFGRGESTPTEFGFCTAEPGWTTTMTVAWDGHDFRASWLQRRERPGAEDSTTLATLAFDRDLAPRGPLRLRTGLTSTQLREVSAASGDALFALRVSPPAEGESQTLALLSGF